MPETVCTEPVDLRAVSDDRPANLSFESVDPGDERAVQLISELDEFTMARYPGMPMYGIEPDGFISAGGTFLLSHVCGELAGCGALRPLSDGSSEVKRMYVRQRFRGRGLARHMLQTLESISSERGVRVMRVETGDRQPEALRLYRSAGYADIPRYGAYLDSADSICLAKPLLTPGDLSFLNAFENCTLPAREWTHLAHVRIAWLMLTQASSDRALPRIRMAILRYNTNVLNRRSKYHETVTVAFARIVSSRIRPTETWAEFSNRIDDVLDKSKPILRAYYSEDALFSETARKRFVAPDRCQLPPFRDQAT